MEDTFKTKVTVDITSDTKQRESDMDNLFKSHVKETHKVRSYQYYLSHGEIIISLFQIGDYTVDPYKGYSFRAIGGIPIDIYTLSRFYFLFILI